MDDKFLPKDYKLAHFAPGSDQFIDHPSQARIGIHPFPDRLYIVTMLENPLRYRRRYENFWAFENHVEKSGGILYVAEVAFGERRYEVTQPGNPQHLQLRASQEPWTYELWHKENVLNRLIQQLPPEAKYIAWIDSDVRFARPDWCQETLHLLQHYQFLQMFSHTIDLGPNDEPLGQSQGYVYTKLDRPYDDVTAGPGYYGTAYYGKMAGGVWVHPGFAWAARRDALNQVGGLVDWCIIGNGDWVMGAALFGQVDRALFGVTNDAPDRYHPNYKKWAYLWQERAEQYIKHNVSYMPGLVHHRWHGRKIDRKYNERWKLLVETQYNPETDLKRDTQGLWTLTDRSMALRDGIRRYAKLRNEDSMEL